MAYDATYNMPMRDTYDPSRSAQGSLAEGQRNQQGIQAQLSIVNAKYNAEKNDGPQIGSSVGGSAGFFSSAMKSIAVTAGATALLGPAGGAVAGAIMSATDAAGFVSSSAAKPQENRYYSLNAPLDKAGKDIMAGSSASDLASEYIDGGTGENYTDTSGKTYNFGFAAPQAPLAVSGGFMDKMREKGESYKMREILDERDALVGKISDNARQTDSTLAQKRTLGLTNIDTYVAKGPPPPVPGMM